MTAVSLRPLGITLAPIPGESLMSLISRHAVVNHLPRSATVLSVAGLENCHVAHVPFADPSAIEPLAAVLGTSVDEIRSRMHCVLPERDSYEKASYFGGSIRRVLLEARYRRVALTSLDIDDFHRPTWAIRALSFCPETFEILHTRCWECGRALGWGTCPGFHRCNRCNADLNRGAIRFVDENLRNECSAASHLVNASLARRNAARRHFDPKFSEWDPCELFAAVVECGIADMRLGESVADRNRKIASGDYSDVGPAEIAAGTRFLSSFEESLVRYAERSYQIIGSTSLRRGFGLLGKYLGSHRQQLFSTPLGAALRDAWPKAAERAKLPLKRWAGSTVVAVERQESVSMMEACKIVGARTDQMRLLKRESATFLNQANDRGGTVLFERAAVEKLAEVFRSSMSNVDASRALGVSKEVVNRFGIEGLLAFPDSVDEETVSIRYRRITKSSVVELQEKLAFLSSVDGDQSLCQFIGQHGETGAWFNVTCALLAGKIDGVGPRRAPAASFADLMVAPSAKPRLAKLISSSQADSVLSGLQTASLIGTSGQFVSAAVAGGLIPGRSEPRRLQIEAAEVDAFRKRYMLTAEAASLLECRTHQAKRLLKSLGVSPVAMFYKVNVYDRSQAVSGAARHKMLVNQNHRSDARNESFSLLN